MSKLIKEGLLDWLANLIATRKLKEAEKLFVNDPLLRHRFKEFRAAEENLVKTWEEICAERKGTKFDCDELDKMSDEMDIKLGYIPRKKNRR